MHELDSKVNALITLLGDENPDVRKIARDKLLNSGDHVFPVLRSIADIDSEGRIRIEARIILEENRLQRLTAQFKTLNDTEELDLEQAAFILAQIEYPELDVKHYVNIIDEFAEDVDKKLLHNCSPLEKIEKISQYLFTERGFKGSLGSYYDPENSFINRVLDRLVGIPISLSAIYLFIASRLDLPIDGVGFPGHFLLKYGEDSNLFFIDAFNSGQILTRDDCEVFLNKMGYRFHDFYLHRATARDILSRMIRNLVLVYLENNQSKKIATLERIFNNFIMD